MTPNFTEGGNERFTSRLEAFSDLVFGFSLSLLATRLDIPARPEEVFESTRWLAVGTTFALICRFWLEHYRVFRHHFVAKSFDMVVNFVFLFAIAVVPYTVQTFLRFKISLLPFSLYLADLSLILVTLSTLRVRSLWQRRSEANEGSRLSDWRRSVLQCGLAIGALILLAFMHRPGADFQNDLRLLSRFMIVPVAALVLLTRAIRKLPDFLRIEN